MKQALALHLTNGNKLLTDSIEKEDDSLVERECFEFKEKNYKPGSDFQFTTLHMVFDVKQDR